MPFRPLLSPRGLTALSVALALVASTSGSSAFAAASAPAAKKAPTVATAASRAQVPASAASGSASQPIPDAVTSASGLVYQSLREGSGASPVATDRVRVNYRGTFADGKEFDSSYKRGQPAEFPLDHVIRCWTEGVQKMKVGGKAHLTCPPEIAYGPNGRPPVIPPATTLQFDVELLAINGQQ